MEAVIARLLSDFETGRLSRRQLVQTLALVAVGSPVASAMAQSIARPELPKPAAAPWKTVWLDHISFRCTDYKKSAEFYSGLMGWEVKKDTGVQAELNINGIGGIIIRTPRRREGADSTRAAQPTQPPTPAAGATTAANRAPVTAVIDHISWGVTPWDKDAVKAELEHRGLNPRPDFQDGGFESYHVRDPDGWDLQISNQTKEKHQVGA